MSNMSLFKNGGSLAVPDYLSELDETTKALAGNGGGKQISIKGGVWRMVVGGEEVARNEDRAMNFVVLGAAPKVSRVFYAGEYEEGKDAPPACWSADGDRPNEEVPAESRQSSSCATCPNNVAGSGQGSSRACRYNRRLAVALENDLEGNIYRLQLPAKSLFGKAEGDKMPLDAYAKFLAGHGVPITGVVTEARFDTAEAVPVLKFRAVRPLTREEYAVVKVVSQSEEVRRAVEMKMVVKAPSKGEPEGSKEYKAADTTAQQPESEPSRRASRTAKPVPPTEAAGGKSVADVLNAWGSDDA
jgi:hypothetical protein